jgi:hypothetical protein
MDQRRLPAGRVVEKTKQRPCRLPSGRFELDHDDVLLRLRGELVEVDPERDDRVLALEALCGRLGSGRRGREERVDPRSEAVAPRPSRRVREAVDGEERRGGQCVGRGESEVREARKSGLEPVHHVEAAVRQSKSKVRAHGDRDAHVRSPRERDRRADRDDVLVGSPLQRSSPGEEVSGARGRREHRHVVAETPKRGGGAPDVHVDLVRLRPREGRDEADAKAHASQVTS